VTRRRHLIAYDIADPKRLRQVIKVMEGYGERLQYSVFLCDLSGVERASWEHDMRAVLNLGQDSIVRIDLGALGSSAPIVTLGTARHFPSAGPTIV
jgi:CRISPR-associated protein Cas2